MHRRIRLAPVTLIAALVAGACSAGGDLDPDADAAPDPPTVTVVQAEESPVEDVPSALEALQQPGLPEPLVEPRRIRAGGPPPDGIPPIDDPVFHPAADVDFLADDEAVLAVEIDGDARAYPVQVMTWHEIVNDTFGDVPVTITYCPLCNTAVGVERTLEDGRVVSFSTSGALYNSSLVMYDRQTQSMWTHFDGRAIAGVLTGTTLERVPVQTISWSAWLAEHPEGLVLSRETEVDRDYGRNPYPGYDDPESFPFLFDGEVDERLAVKERVVGFGLGREPTAVVLAALLDDGVVMTELGGRPVAVWARRGTASALDGRRVADGRDVGATGVFVAEADGQSLTFVRDGERFVDEQTSTTWNVLGRGVDGPLAGRQLEALEHVDTFWFAWAAFSPDTRVVPAVR